MPTWIRKVPDDFEDLGLTGMSNLFLTVDAGVGEKLRSGKFYAHHASLDFNGDVWWEDGSFHETVNRWHIPVAHFEADSLEDLMTAVNNVYGWKP